VEHGPLTDLAVCIVAAWLFGVVAHVLRQPVLLAYLAAGYVIGPSGIGFITSEESTRSIGSIGLVLLLFVIGLEIDLKRVLGASRTIVATATVQILGTLTAGVLFFRLLGFRLGDGHFEALYLGMAAFVSSTVIAVKILADRRELDTLAGRMTIGIAVLQDIAVIVFLGLQPALGDPSLLVVFRTLFRIGVLIGLAVGVSRYLLPPLFRRVAKLPELIAVGALAWCFVVAALADSLGLSHEMGALVAGVAISTFPYSVDVTAKAAGLRDFFITLFFVGLGLKIPPPEPGPLAVAAGISVFVAATRFVTVMGPLRLLGLGNRVGFLTTLNLVPLSEFALVIVTVGIRHGHVDREIFAPIVYAFIGLAVVGSYAIARSDPLFRRIEPWLVRVGLRDDVSSAVPAPATGPGTDIFVLGFSWSASSLLEEITRHQPGYLPRLAVIDFNPEVHRRLVARGVRAIWGDVSQRDTLEHAGVAEARLVLCTLPNTILRGIDNLRLVELVRTLNPSAAVVAHAERLGDIPRLKAAGASHVLAGRFADADELIDVISAADHHQLQDRLARLERRLEGRNEVVP
jgi:Kef-type K+ transport system membrane component KefB